MSWQQSYTTSLRSSKISRRQRGKFPQKNNKNTKKAVYITWCWQDWTLVKYTSWSSHKFKQNLLQAKWKSFRHPSLLCTSMWYQAHLLPNICLWLMKVGERMRRQRALISINVINIISSWNILPIYIWVGLAV